MLLSRRDSCAAARSCNPARRAYIIADLCYTSAKGVVTYSARCIRAASKHTHNRPESGNFLPTQMPTRLPIQQHTGTYSAKSAYANGNSAQWSQAASPVYQNG